MAAPCRPLTVFQAHKDTLFRRSRLVFVDVPLTVETAQPGTRALGREKPIHARPPTDFVPPARPQPPVAVSRRPATAARGTTGPPRRSLSPPCSATSLAPARTRTRPAAPSAGSPRGEGLVEGRRRAGLERLSRTRRVRSASEYTSSAMRRTVSANSCLRRHALAGWDHPLLESRCGSSSFFERAPDPLVGDPSTCPSPAMRFVGTDVRASLAVFDF